MSVELRENAIIIRDYFAGENRGEFQIISFEDCELEVSLEQTPINV